MGFYRWIVSIVWFTFGSFRPLARVGWFSTKRYVTEVLVDRVFPAPIEVWVGSYQTKVHIEKDWM